MQATTTFAMIKPGAVAGGHTGAILAQILDAGFSLVALKSITLTRKTAMSFYHEHQGKDFFDPLIDFMISGPVVVMVLRHTDAIQRFRALIGATDPAKAAEGTIRHRFGGVMPANAIHGSDSELSADRESSFFFPGIELI